MKQSRRLQLEQSKQRLVNRARWSSYRWWWRINRRSGYLPKQLQTTVTQFQKRSQPYAVGFAFWALLSLFPLIILLILITAHFFPLWFAQEKVFNTLQIVLPDGGTNIIQASIQAVLQRRNLLGFVSVFGLFMSASQMFSRLQQSFNVIFEIKRKRGVLMHYLINTLMVLALVGTLFLWPYIFTFVFRPSTVLLDTRLHPSLWLSGLLYMLLLAVTFRVFPQQRLRWVPLLISATLGAALLVVVRELFAWYSTYVVHFNAVYGTAAAIVGLMFWLYFVGNILMFTAELVVGLNDWWSMSVKHW
jgi:membrane protein